MLKIFSLVFLFLSASLLLIVSPVRCQILLTSSQIYSEETNKLLLISNEDTSAILSLSIYKNFSKTIYSAPIHFKKAQLLEWPIDIPEDSKVKTDSIFLKLSYADGHSTMDKLTVSHENGFVFFQTEKPIYRFSDTAKFRVIRLNRSMSLMEDECIIRIKNHQDIKVDEAKIFLKAPQYIGEYSFNFPINAKSGVWFAELSCGPNLEFKESRRFEIMEYELPMFKLEVDLPKFILLKPKMKAQKTFCTTSTEYPVNMSLNATYTYGKPVSGTVYFNIFIKARRKNIHIKSTNSYKMRNGALKLPLLILCLEDYYFEENYRLLVETIITDDATGITDKYISSNSFLIKSPYSISTRNTIFQYKPYMANYLMFEVINSHNNESAADVPVEISLQTHSGYKIESIFVSSQIDNEHRSDQNGLAVYTFKLVETIGPLKVTFKTKDPNYENWQQASKTFYINPYNSEETAFIIISNKRELYYTTESRFFSTITYHGNVDLNSIYLIVISKGVTILTRKIEKIEDELKFELNLTIKMVPSIRLLIVGLDENGNLLSDSFRIFVRQERCSVQVDLKKPVEGKTIEPKQDIVLQLKGEKNDVVGFQIVDEALYLVRNVKRQAQARFNQLLSKSDLGCGSGGGGTSLNVIQNSGLNIWKRDSSILNSCKNLPKAKRSAKKRNAIPKVGVSYIYLNNCCKLASRADGNIPCAIHKKTVENYTNSTCAKEFHRCCMEIHNKNRIRYQASVAKAQESVVQQSKTEDFYDKVFNEDEGIIRSDFRDSWLFDIILLDSNEQDLSARPPDTITSWFIMPISISQRDGLCFNPELRFTTFKPFFIKVLLPSNIIQYEQTEVSVTVFNHLKEKLQIVLFLYRNEEICSEAIFPSKRAEKNVSVLPENFVKISFPIIPIQPGIFTIKVKAVCHMGIDVVKKNLTVHHPGIAREKLITFDLDPSNKTRRAPLITNEYFTDITHASKSYQETHINLKGRSKREFNIVPNTTRYIINALGERFSPKVMSIEDLSHLIKKPKGCGEQNMFYMAFNLYTLNYLKEVKKLNKKLENKGVEYLKRAYSQQMEYRKSDGSFSAFKRRSSSVWLTAFVSKILCKASPFLNKKLDSNVITKAIEWLQLNQSKDGSWVEIHPLLHEKAFGNNKSKKALTAYILIALNECQSYLNSVTNNNDINRIIEKAGNFIHSNDKNSNDPYSLALISYALTFHKSHHEMSKEMLGKLLKSSSLKKDLAKNHMYWDTDYPTETTAYALLSLTKMNKKMLSEYMPISNWLTSLQKDGTFDNTQNTIVALEALTTYYRSVGEHINQEDIHMSTNISFDSRFKREERFNKSNIDMMRTIEVDKGTSKVVFKTNGNGLGKVDLFITYNEYNPNDTCFFEFDVDLVESFPEKNHNHLVPNDFDGFDNDLIREIEPKNKRKSRSFYLPGLNSSSRNKQKSFPQTLVQKSSQKKLQISQCEKSLGHLPPLNIENPVIRLLNICIKGYNTGYDMTILEVSMLSGYEAVENDLKKLENSDNDFVESYQNQKSKVIFYLGKIPHSRQYCLCFRINRKHNVKDTQSALVKVYDFYNEKNHCTRLYSDVRTTDYLNFQCKEEYCKCVVKKKCPNNEVMLKLVKLSSIDLNEAENEFYRLICSYSIVMIGKVTKKEEMMTTRNNTSFTVYTIATKKQIVKNINLNKEFQIRMNPECSYQKSLIKSDILIMFNPQGDSIELLNGESIFYLVEEFIDNSLYLWERSQRDCNDNFK